jgi:hypothetical protein
MPSRLTIVHRRDAGVARARIAPNNIGRPVAVVATDASHLI